MMNRDDTIEAFACCTQIPPDCTNCPEKGPTGELGRNCKSDVKTSVYHWLVVQEPVVRCKDCKYFEVKDLWADFGKVPILVSDVPTCHRWEGECKTSPDGYCFLGEWRDSNGKNEPLH